MLVQDGLSESGELALLVIWEDESATLGINQETQELNNVFGQQRGLGKADEVPEGDKNCCSNKRGCLC